MDAAPQPSAEPHHVSFLPRSYRHCICTLAYVRINHANGGIIRNLSDSGMAIQAVGRLHPEQLLHLRFEFIRPRAKFELTGQVAWANANGQAGLRFIDVPLRSRRILKDWILTDLLTASSELAATSLVLKSPGVALEDGLVISGAPLRTIPLVASPPANTLIAEFTGQLSDGAARVTLPWWPASIHQRAFARFVDGVTVISAVLLFSIIVVELTDIFPTWQTLICAEAGVALAFALLYYHLCRLTMGSTLGARLAQLAADEISQNKFSSSLGPL
jgi:hypothetical protein